MRIIYKKLKKNEKKILIIFFIIFNFVCYYLLTLNIIFYKKLKKLNLIIN